MHIPVLQKEVLQYLDPRPNQNFVDATIGGAGHALAILEKNRPKGKILGIDRDPDILKILKQRLQTQKYREAYSDRVILVCENFANLKTVAEKEGFQPIHPVRGQRRLAGAQRKQISNGVHGILFDLGFSSWHLAESKRGFSFLKDEPLDMRYAKSSGVRAEEMINQQSQEEIEKILREYGEERFAKHISKEIVEARKKKPIKTTFQLVEIIKKAVPGWYQHKKIHFATRTFQALRIAVNSEISSLEKALPQALDILTPGGRLAVISFHSLEDRIVKYFFKKETEKGTIKILTKKPVRPSNEEIKINPAARSAKLRAAVKT